MRIKESVYNRLCEFRHGKNMTQEFLAKEAGVTRQTIIAIEKGNYTPSVLLAIKISKVFGIKVEEIFYL